MHRFLFLTAACLSSLACGSSTAGGTSSTGGSGASGSTGAAISSTTSSAGSPGSSAASSTGGAATSGSTSGGATTGGTTGIAGLGQACEAGEDPDPCATDGLVCDPTSSTCQLPGELEECLSTVGCSAPGLACTGGFENGGGQAVSICVYPCTQTADCPDLITSCQHGVCFLNYCQTGDNGNINYFQPCPSASAADGECLPVFTGFNEVAGLCVGAGTLANGQGCVASRTDAGSAGLCLQGSDCAFFDGGAEHPSVSLCEPVCYSNDEVPGGGPTCAAGNLCFNFSSYYGYGNCYLNCAADAGQTCPDGQFCDGFEFFTTPYSVCVPN